MLAWSICLLMVTMPETVAHRMDSIEPSPADMGWRALGEWLGTSVGSKRRAFPVSAKMSPRIVRVGWVLAAGDGEAGLVRCGVLALLIAWARAWLPGGMGGISVI